MKVNNIYVLGVFDLFHVGHLNMLEKAKSLGGKLHVGINSDRVVKEYKRQPIIPQDERLAIVAACSYVDESFVVDTFDNKAIVLNKKINLIVHGDDWKGDSYLDQIRLSKDFVLENDIELIFLPYYEGRSTSDLIKIIKEL